MAVKKSTLRVMTKVRELTRYVFDACDKAPKTSRFTFCVRLENYCLDTIECVYKANMEKEPTTRLFLQETAKTNLAMIDYFSCLSLELKVITMKQYEVISLHVAECIKLLVAWKNANKRNTNEVLAPIGDNIKG